MGYMDNNTYTELTQTSLQSFDIAIVESTMSGIPLEATLGKALQMNLSVTKSMVAASIKDFKIMAEEVYELVDFYEKIYTSPLIDNLPLTTTIYDIDIVKGVKPIYLQQIPNDTIFVIDNFLKKKITKDNIERKYLTKEYILSRKKSVIKNDNRYYDNDVKKIMLVGESDGIVTKVDSELISTVILPFLRSIPQKIKEFEVMLSQIVTAIENGVNDFVAIAKTLDSNKLSPDTIKYPQKYLLASMRAYIQVYTYMTNMMFKDAILYRKSIESYKELQSKMLRYFPEGVRALHESVLDGEMSDMDPNAVVVDILNNNNSFFRSALNTITSEIMGDIIFATGTSDITDIVEAGEYASKPYQIGLNIFNSIDESFKIISDIMDDPVLSFSDILDRSNMNESSLVERFASYVSDISDTTLYDKALVSNPNDEVLDILIRTMTGELIYAKNAMDEISDRIYKTYNTYKDIMMRLSQLDTVQFANTEVVDELLKYMSGMDADFKQLILVVIKAYSNRIQNVSALVRQISDKILQNPDIGMGPKKLIDPFEELAGDTILDINDSIHTYTLEQMSVEIQMYNLYKATGVKPIYEELATSPNAETKKDSNASTTKPTVSGNTSSASKENIIKSIIEKVKAFFSKSRTMLNDIVKKQSGNVDILKKNRDAIINQSFTGVQINVVPYEKYINEDMIKADIKAVISKVNAFNPKDTNLSTKDGLNKYLFSFMGNGLHSNNLNEFTKKYYKVKTAKLETATYSGNAIKTLAPIMVDYCINYYTTFGNDLDKLLTELENALNNKISGLENVNESFLGLFEEKESTTTASVVKTDEANNTAEKNTAGDNKKLGNMEAIKTLSTAIQNYTAGVLSATRDRNYDYLKIIKMLTPKNAETTSDDAGTQESETNTEEK